MTTQETNDAKRAPYRPIKRLRAFADALWLVSDDKMKQADKVRITAKTSDGYNITIVTETEKSGQEVVAAYASKRGVPVARLGTLEYRKKPTRRYAVRVILRPISFDVDAVSKADAIHVAKVLLSEDNELNPLLKARIIAVEAK